MTTPNDPSTQALSPEQLANQLFDAAILQYRSPREAARQVIVFLTEALISTINETAGDDVARKALLKSVGDTITAAPHFPDKAAAKP